MAVTSPRASARFLAQVPIDWPDAEDHLRLITSAIHQLQGMIQNVEAVSVSATYTMIDTDILILGNTSGGSITVNLLTATGREGRLVEVKKTEAANNLVIDPAGSETIDGNSTITLTDQWSMRGMRSDGTNWNLVASI